MKKTIKQWTMKGGEKIRVCDMTDEHLMNTIKFIEGVVEKSFRNNLNAAYQLSCILGGDIAEWQMDRDIAEVEEEGPQHPEIYYNMKDEMDNRGLKFFKGKKIGGVNEEEKRKVRKHKSTKAVSR